MRYSNTILLSLIFIILTLICGFIYFNMKVDIDKKSCYICDNKFHPQKIRWNRYNNIPINAKEFGIEKKFDKLIKDDNDIICNSCSKKVFEFMKEKRYNHKKEYIIYFL